MKIEMVPHNPQWKSMFEAEAERLQSAFGGNLVALHHIGSTSIPPIHAKPIIDMLAEVKEIEAVDPQNDEFEALGYEPMGEFGLPGRRFFRKTQSGKRTHHIHAFAHNSSESLRHLHFRDYMRAHPSIAAEYSELKQTLAAAHPNDIEAYMDGKNGFIKEHEARAIAWQRDGLSQT